MVYSSKKLLIELKNIKDDIEVDEPLSLDGFLCYSTKDPVHCRIFFKNGYGASIIRQDGSYGSKGGLFELGVIKHETINEDIRDWRLNYDTKITDDVLGYLTGEEILNIVNEIKNIKG